MTEEQLAALGTELAKFFQIKPNKNTNRYDTQWGDKTAIGVARCVLRMIDEAEQVKDEQVDEQVDEPRD
jgi:hypothetical protein